MAQLPKERTRLRAVDPHYCKHPNLIPIWKYKRFPGKTFCKCLVCGREVVMQAGIVTSATVTAPPRATRQESNSWRLVKLVQFKGEPVFGSFMTDLVEGFREDAIKE